MIRSAAALSLARDLLRCLEVHYTDETTEQLVASMIINAVERDEWELEAQRRAALIVPEDV